jgi:hypothetical protein
MKTREMRNMRRDSRLSVMVLTGLMIAAPSHAAEKRISKSALPPAVAKTADEQSTGATVQGYMQDNDNGQVEYEVEMTVNGHSKDVTIEPSGQVLEVEEQVELSALPAVVVAGLKDKAGHGKITKVESITKHRAIVAYEVQVSTLGKHSEIQVGPHGKPLDHEE